MTVSLPLPSPAVPTRTSLLALGSALILGLLVLSGIAPYDRPTWFLEVAPVLIALPVLWATHRRFPLTPLLYVLIFLHCAVLMLGSAYTYARVPLGLERNPYDRIGHFFQGFVPALAIGATTVLVALSRLHDRQIRAVTRLPN